MRSLRDIMPGVDLGLDIICDGILHETPFLYPAEEVRPRTQLERFCSEGACLAAFVQDGVGAQLTATCMAPSGWKLVGGCRG